MTILGDAGRRQEPARARALGPGSRTKARSRCAAPAAASPYGQGITYWPLAEVLREHFGILESESAGADRSSVSASGSSSRLTLGLDVAEGLHPAGRPRPASRTPGSSSSSERRARSARSSCSSRMSTGPSDQLLELLERLLERRPGAAAPDRDGPAGAARRAGPVGAARGPTRAARARAALRRKTPVRLLDELLADRAPGGLREVVVERAEGNPFFVEELLGDADRPGRPRAGTTARGRSSELPGDFEVPDSVQAVLAARIDLLSPPRRRRCRRPRSSAASSGRAPSTSSSQGRARPRAARGARLRPPPLGLVDAGRARVRDQARAHARGRLREPAESAPGAAARGFAAGSSARAAERDELAPLLAHHYAEAVRPEDADLAWADDEAEASCPSGAGGPVAAPGGRAGRRPVRARGCDRLLPPSDRARGRPHRAGEALVGARRRPRLCASTASASWRRWRPRSTSPTTRS